MFLDQSNFHELAQSQCGRGLHKVTDAKGNEKTGGNSTMERRLHTDLGLGFSGQGLRRIRLQISRVLMRKPRAAAEKEKK